MKFDNSTIPLWRRTSRWRTGLLGIAAALFMAPAVEAQLVSTYSFSQATGTYAAVTGTALGTATNDDTSFPALPIGFTFTYNGVAYTTFSASSNGFIAMGSTVSSSYTAISSGTSNNVIAGMNADMQGQTGASMLYATTGTAPNRKLVMQWTNWKRYGSSGTGHNLNWQIVLNEAGGVVGNQTVQVIYGANTFNTTSSTLEVGIRGASSADYSNRSTATNWNSTVAGTSNAATCTILNTVTPPASGLTFTWTPPAACTGTPAPGNTTGPALAGVGDVINLGIQNTNLGSGITYQWYYSTTSAVAGFSPGGTGPTYSPTFPGQSWYYAAVSCGANTAPSNVLQVDPTYCTPTVTYTGDHISNFSTTAGVTNITNNGSGISPGNYGNFTAMAVSAADGTSFNFSTTYVGGGNGVRIWVDWNNNMGFEPGESVFYLADGNATKTGTITVPSSTAPGNYRMRVRAQYGSAVDPPPCGSVSFGETEDYTLTVFANTACIGTPTPGNITGPSGTASGGTVNLGIQNVTTGSGVSYQWFVSTTSAVAGFSPVGPDASTYSPTVTVQSWYYVDVICATGGTGSSTVKQIDILLVNLVPQTGSATLLCGTNTILRDHAGTGDYTSNADGYIVLEAGGTATISITGDYNTESCCDDIFIYAGAGIGGTQLANYFGSGTANFTGAPGQTITVRFVTDVSLTYSGFDFNVSYSGACPTCIQPTALAATNVTSGGADLSWTCTTCTGSYIVEYGAPGFTPGTGSTPGVGGTVWTGTAVPSSPVTLTGLSSLTAYSVVVREMCGPSDFSANSMPANFATLCGGTTCDYVARIGDIFGDGWDGSEWQVKQNGVVVATLGPQIVGCGDGAGSYVDVPVTICEGATVTLEWTTLGNYTDEKAIQFYNPFGVLLYSYRGTASYPGNCDAVNWTSANSTGSLGVKLTTTGNCTPPSCTVSTDVVNESCTAGTYDIAITAINVTGTGTIQYSLNGVAQPNIPFASPTTTISGINIAQAAYITLVTTDGCTNVIGNVQSSCVIELDCEATSPLPFEHCYSTGDARTWYFQTPEVGGKVDLKFTAGTLLAGDQIKIWDGAPNASTVIFTIAGTDGAIANTVYTGTTSGYMGVSIVTNATGSCQESSGTPWEFYVRCSGCVEPEGVVTVDSPGGPTAVVDCNTGTFEVVVTAFSTGIDKVTGTPPATVGISYTVNDGPRIFWGYTTEFVDVSLGTAFILGQNIEVTLEHEDQVNNSACNTSIGTGTVPLDRCPPANDDCANAITIPVGVPGSCPAGQVSGSTFGADMTGVQPTCATGPVHDVWYFMDTNGFAQPLMTVTGSTGPVGLELYTACGGTPGICNNDVTILTQPFTFNIPQGQYYLRFYTPVGGDSQFAVCVTGELEGYECDGAINIPSVPVTNQSLVCGSVPSPGLLTATNVPDLCGSASNSYKGAAEALYTFTPSVSGSYAIEYTGVSWSSIFVYADACPTNGGTCVGSVGSSATAVSLVVALTSGTTYYVWFDNWPSPNESPCPGSFNMALLPPPPANDDCAAAISLDASTLTCTPTDGNTASATQSFAGCSGTANDDVWYSFLATETSHVVRVNGYGTFDPVMELFDGGVEPGVCPIASPGITCQNATAAGGLETFTAVGLSIGNRYFVRVYDSGTGVFYSTAPSFNICVTKVPTCLAPTANAATGITTGTAVANWTPNSGGSGTNFIVEYGPTATFTTPGTGLTAGTNGTVILNAVSPQTLSGLTHNTQYRYFVRQNCTGTAEGFSFNSNAITFTTLALPPANNECAGAVSLSGTNTTCINTLGTIAGATQSLPGCLGTSDDDVWYSFVASGAGNYSITVTGFDAVHELFSGTCGSLTSIACSDATIMTVQGLTAGNVYYVRVYSWSSVQPAIKEFNICVVKNSDCLPPSTITTTNITSSSADVTVSGSPTANYILEYGLSSNFTTPGLAGTAGTNGTVIAFTGNLQQISGLAVTTTYRYFVRRDCGTGIYSANSFAQTFTTLGLPPANDLCANAVTVTCGNTYTGTNVNATTDSAPVAVTTGQQIMTNGVWYKFVGTNQSVTLSTCNSSFDTRLHVYSGTCGNPVVIGGNEDDDDGCTIFTSKVTFNAILGTTYYIAIDGYGSYSTGSISLDVTCGALCLAASNDECANATVLTVSPIGFCNPVSGTTVCATPGVGIPNPSCASSPFDSYPDVYYTFTAAGTSHPIQVNQLSGTLEFWVLNELSCGGQEDFCSTTFNSLVSVTGLTSGAVYSLRIGSEGDATFDVCIGAPTCSQDVTVEWQLGATGAVPAWEMRQVGTNVVVANGGGFNAGAPFAVYPETTCLPEGKFYFDMLSNLDAGGGYKVRLGQAPFTRFIDNTVAVGSSSITELTAVPAALGSNGPLQIPVGPNELLYSSCDKYFWATGEYIVVNEDPQVAATWIVGQGDAAQSSTSGYDFWFYNPDGGYSYIRQRRNNVSDNFGNVGSARTCHMKVNNWAAANHIPNGAQLNVRVRAVVNNVPKNWGPACRFVRDEALAACTPTKLFDIPGHFAYSCNVFRAFNTATANRLYARPVGGATKYRFHIYNGETDITLERTVYYLTLGWAASVAAPLQDEAVYDVTVQAFVGGVWCPVGEVCTVQICNTPASCTNDIAGGQQNSVLDTDAAFRMWPNPNNGALLNVNLSGVEEGTNTVSMDVFDLSGKRIIARTLAVQGGFVSQVVDLNGEISTGMYMVRVTAGDQVYSERLVIQK